MIQSMTGFGSTTVTTPERTLTIELRSLNSKQLDLYCRIHLLFKEKENDIRNIIANTLERGKIDLTITVENKSTAQQSINIDRSLAKAYHEAYTSLAVELNSPNDPYLFFHVLRSPDVIGNPTDLLDENTWEALKIGISQCLQKVIEFRISEGAHLYDDFVTRMDTLHKLAAQVDTFEGARTSAIREKLFNALDHFCDTVQYDAGRLEQEMIYYIEKLDITEEKVRLCKHCQYFMETLQNPQSQGKKLGFIIQEMGREVNTIGSKANDFNIQQLVVCMKDEIEKMKEQISNVL
ncbi:MAG: YicC family protein [Bacteroidales bacterium]|jgi:uncharacterized protein (TIGR00255 family)|nr:YicC family protein [Bacteroidales bacterium]